MESDIIQAKLQARFAAPLQDFYKRRIIFWQDEDSDGSEMIDTFEFSDVKIIKLTGSNNFAVKKLLLEDDTESNYLVYNPISYDDIKDDWLLDVEMFSEEFRADVLSLCMDELGIPATAQLRKTMKLYSKFFDNGKRVAKFKNFGTSYESAGQIHIDVLSVLSDTAMNTPAGIIRAVLMAGVDNDENAALENIEKFGDINAFWQVVNRYTGFEYSENSNLSQLATHILLSALSVTMQSSFFKGLESFVSEIHQANCYSLINEWMHSEDDNVLYDICRMVEDECNLEARFDALDVSEMLGSECFPCINESILRKFMNEISDNVIKIEEILNTVEKRRTMKWYKRVRYYYDGILQVAKMQQFYQEHITGFHIAQYRDMWKNYQEEYYLMDSYYRMFHTAFGLSLKQLSTVLEDSFKNVADYVEGLYKNWYLKELSTKWTDLAREELEKDAMLRSLEQQTSFYQKKVVPILNAGTGSRVFVIVSDALRYEVAAQLNEELLRETKGTSSIGAMQAVCPSVTKYGMAALLPHDNLTVDENLKVFCDGISTEGTENRDKILKNKNKDSVAIRYKDLLAMKDAEMKELVADKKVIYIYHNKIDSTGEAMASEDQVFEACEATIGEIKTLIRTIINKMNGTNILITADHGFLYSYKSLDISDKAEKDYVDGVLIEVDRRYIISDRESVGEHVLRIPMQPMSCDYYVMIPQNNIRFKSGGGMNYVHGGVSLQEMMVPVITFKNMKASNKKFVEVSKAKVELISSSRKISNSIFSLDFYQKEPVGGKVTECAYSVYFTDVSGKTISDVQTIIADKTSDNGSERVFRTRFTLKAIEFKKTDTYYLTIAEKDGSGIPEKVEFTINIAFANDFDF